MGGAEVDEKEAAAEKSRQALDALWLKVCGCRVLGENMMQMNLQSTYFSITYESLEFNEVILILVSLSFSSLSALKKVWDGWNATSGSARTALGALFAIVLVMGLVISVKLAAVFSCP